MARAIDADDLIRHAKETKITAIFPNYTEFSSETGNAIGMYGQYWKTLLEDAPTIEPKQEWISVRDRLPNRGERVLCFMKSSGKNQNDTISDNVYNGILVGSNPPKYVWEWNGGYVTHWMPLPEPPKEGE